MSAEHPVSRLIRRLAAVISVLAIPVTVMAAVAGSEYVSTLALLTAMLLPWATFIIHFNLFSPLTPEAKELWRKELGLWSGNIRNAIACWAYLVASDLEVRARQFGPYRGGSDE
jgi:hypothetical protein